MLQLTLANPGSPGKRPLKRREFYNAHILTVQNEVDTKVSLNALQSIAFHDVNPQAPVHFLVVPKKVIHGIPTAQDDDKEVTANRQAFYR